MPAHRNDSNKKFPIGWRLRRGAYLYRVPPAARHHWGGKSEFLLGHTLAEAHATFASRIGHEYNVYTMAQLCDRYLIEVVPTKRAATQKSNVYSLQRLRSVFDNNDLTAIEPHHIYDYRNTIGASESHKKANLDLEVLSHIFTKAIEWGLRKDHPMTGKKVVKFSLDSRTRYITDEELLAFMTLLDPKWELFVALLVWTGRRKAELLNVRHRDLLEQGIRFQNVKGKREYFILGWTPEIRSLVESVLALKSHPKAIHLFHNRSGQPYINIKGETSGVDSIWQRAQAKAIDRKIIDERFTLHDLRAKRASDMSLAQAQSLLRHTSAVTTQKSYRRLPEMVNLT